MLKYFIIVLFISTSFTQISNNEKSQNLKPKTIDIWGNENKKIENPKLKKELLELNEVFKYERENINNNFKEKIKPFKIKRDNDISNLKNTYLKQRELLFEEYGVKRDPQLRKNEKENFKSKKQLPYYKKHRQIPGNQ